MENSWMIRLVQSHYLFIKNNMKNNNTCVLALVMFYETRHKNAIKYFSVLSCVIYTILDNYACIYYLACQSNKLSDIFIDRKYFEKV